MVLPLAKSGIATVGTFVFLHVWNSFLRFNSAGKTGAYQPKSDHL